MSMTIIGLILTVPAVLIGWLAWKFETRDLTDLKLALLVTLLGGLRGWE